MVIGQCRDGLVCSSCAGLAGELHSGGGIAGGVYHGAHEVLVVDTLYAGLDVAGQSCVNCDGSLPGDRHLELLVKNGCCTGSRQILVADKAAAVHLACNLVY